MPVPHNAEEAALYAFVILTGLFSWVIKAAFTALTNHFKHDEELAAQIAKHMEKQNLLLELLVNKIVLEK